MQALYSQYEVFSEFESIEGPLQDKVPDLIQKLAQNGIDLAIANDVIAWKNFALEKKQSQIQKLIDLAIENEGIAKALERSESLRKKADDVIEALTSDLEAARKKGEVEVGKL